MIKNSNDKTSLTIEIGPHQLCLDEESGLYHAGHFRAALELELVRQERWDKSLALVIIKISGLEGRELWAKAGSALSFALRAIDQGARLGAGLAAAILPDADEYRARRMIGEFLHNLSHDPELKKLKPKFGLALSQPWEGLAPDDLLEKALAQASSNLQALDVDGPPCPEPSTAIAADEKTLLFEGFKDL